MVDWTVDGTIDEVSPGVLKVNVNMNSFDIVLEDGTTKLVLEDGHTAFELEQGP
jgi:hypothetical protein